MNPWQLTSQEYSSENEKALSDILRNRYPYKTDKEVIKAFREDIGASAPMHMVAVNSFDDENSLGGYLPRKDIIRVALPLDEPISADSVLDTMAHENVHSIEFGKRASPNNTNKKMNIWEALANPGRHFKDYPGEQGEGLYENMWAQQQMEQDPLGRGFQGLPEQIRNNQPWLRNFEPRASNRLIGPWGRQLK